MDTAPLLWRVIESRSPTANIYQRVVGQALDGDPTCIDSIVAYLQRDISPPTNSAESIHLHQSLSLFLARVAT